MNLVENFEEGLNDGRIEGPGWTLIRDILVELKASKDWPSLQTLNSLLGDGHLLTECGIKFGEQPYFPSRRRNRVGKKLSYETYIFEEGFIPTRDRSWHDFFNALIWRTLPRAKLELSKAQRAAQTERQLKSISQRSSLEDCLTMFDEGGIFTVVSPEIAPVLKSAACGAQESEKVKIFREFGAELHIFGHGILEGIVGGDRGTRAICFVVPEISSEKSLEAGNTEQMKRDSSRQIRGNGHLESRSTILDIALADFIKKIARGMIPPKNFGGYPIDALSAADLF